MQAEPTGFVGKGGTGDAGKVRLVQNAHSDTCQNYSYLYSPPPSPAPANTRTHTQQGSGYYDEIFKKKVLRFWSQISLWRSKRKRLLKEIDPNMILESEYLGSNPGSTFYCVTKDKLFKFSKSQFLHLRNEDDNIYFMSLLWDLNKLFM